MKKLTFGKTPSTGDKVATATKRGYDTGKPSTGSAGPSKWKAAPTVSKNAVGIKLSKKV